MARIYNSMGTCDKCSERRRLQGILNNQVCCQRCYSRIRLSKKGARKKQASWAKEYYRKNKKRLIAINIEYVRERKKKDPAFRERRRELEKASYRRRKAKKT